MLKSLCKYLAYSTNKRRHSADAQFQKISAMSLLAFLPIKVANMVITH